MKKNVDLTKLKVALVHDWLTGMRGGEKVLDALCDIFPQADIFTLIWKKGSVSKKIESRKITTSFLQRLPNIEKNYRNYLPIMPLAIESLDLKGYDLIVSSHHCVVKSVKKDKNAFHICYCFTPMRYIWDQYDEYFNPERAGFAVRTAMKMIRPFLQKWDAATASRVNSFIAISSLIRDRIQRHYGRPSDLIFPPVDVKGFPPAKDNGYFLIVSALVPYKRVDLAVKAFNDLKYPLKIIGTGPDMERLKSLSAPNIEFLGWQDDIKLKEYYSGCKAFIFPQEEDFGITAVEAQAAGKPVIAFRKGGAEETVVDGVTGVFFDNPTHESLKDAVARFEKASFSGDKAIANAAKFSLDRFISEFKAKTIELLSLNS